MANVREAASRTRTNPGVYLYLRDVDLVIGKFAEAENPGETLTYAKDETIVIRPTKASSGQELGCDEESILSFIHLGDEFAFDYGKNVLKVTEINADHMVVRCMSDLTLTGKKSAQIIGSQNMLRQMPRAQQNDQALLEWAEESDAVDFIVFKQIYSMIDLH